MCVRPYRVEHPVEICPEYESNNKQTNKTNKQMFSKVLVRLCVIIIFFFFCLSFISVSQQKHHYQHTFNGWTQTNMNHIWNCPNSIAILIQILINLSLRFRFLFFFSRFYSISLNKLRTWELNILFFIFCRIVIYNIESKRKY